MILTKLSLINFKKYRKKEFIFDEGLIGIIGKNGAGKSTIFEAILFALYGELKTKGYKDIIRNSQATNKEAVSVILEFEFENNLYKVIREFRGKSLSAKAELYKNDELIVTSVKEVNKYIISLVRMNKIGFLNTLFASQKELTSLSNLNKDDRKKLIRKLLGFDKIDSVEIEIKEIIKNLKSELHIYTNDILLNDEEIKDKNKNITELTKQKELLSKQQNEQTKKLDEITKEIIKQKTELSKCEKNQQQKILHQNKLSIIDNDIKNCNNNLKELQQSKNELLQKQQQYQKEKQIKDEYIKLKEILQNQRVLRDKYLQKNTLLKEQELLRDRYKKLKQNIELLQEELLKKGEILNQLKDLNNKIEQLEFQKKELEDKIAGEDKIN